jgi:hypothetical protein
MTLSLRKWSDHVYAFYRDDPGNPFGPYLVYVADSRETVALQAILGESEQLFGYDGERPEPTLATPAGPDRTSLTQQGERL